MTKTPKNRRLWLPTPEYRNRRWTLQWATVPGCHGVCDHDKRTITISPKQSILEQVSTIHHELLHGARGDEETIVSASEAAALTATKLCYEIFDLADAFDDGP